MGNFYHVVNHTTRERLEPCDVDDGCVKKREIVLSRRFAQLLTHAMLHRWFGGCVVFVSDFADERPSDGYEDVTAELIDDFNESVTLDTPLRYNGSVRPPSSRAS